MIKKTSLWMMVTIIFLSCAKEEKNSAGFSNKQKSLKLVTSTGNWPSFRGEFASGVADNQNLPDKWNVKNGEHIQWQVIIPGLAHSSPVIWGNKLFLTSAISSKPHASFRHGLYGDGDASEDRSFHQWKIYCLNKRTGQMIWERTVTEGIPKDRRHIKATYANSTPATDGRYIVMLFGSEGLFVYDMDGSFKWKKNLGRINCGAYDAPEFEWGAASSPIIYKDMVIVQVDTQEDDFIIVCNIKNGKTIWKTERDELPSWGTPTIIDFEHQAQLVTNSSNYIYSYNPNTGKEIWRLGGSSKITAPTPIYNDSLVIVCSGRRPEAPIFAIKVSATGNITLKNGQESNKFVVWSKNRRGPYMPTPLIYRGYLYVLGNSGNLDCYDFANGDEIYRERIPHKGGGFSASPVAADGKLFLSSEDGDIFVIRAGPRYEIIAMNSMGELLMSSPALSDSTLYVRGQHHLFAIGL